MKWFRFQNIVPKIKTNFRETIDFQALSTDLYLEGTTIFKKKAWINWNRETKCTDSLTENALGNDIDSLHVS